MSRLNSSMHVKLKDSIIKTLFTKGIYSGFDFMNKDTNFLVKNTGLSFKEIVEIKNEISKSHGGCNIIDGFDFLKSEKIISSGILSLDELLDGGFNSKDIYEFCGASSSGKTQLCLTIATCIALEKNHIVHYIDTKGDFSVTRIVQILNAKNCSDEDIVRVLTHIKVTQVKSANELFSILHYLGNIEKDKFETKLLMIDSLSNFCLASYTNIETIFSLNHLRNMIRFITNEYNIPVITTNLVTKWNEENPLKTSETLSIFKPMLGKFWFNVPSTRLLLNYVKNEERVISIWQSIDLEIGTNRNLNITSVGFC